MLFAFAGAWFRYLDSCLQRKVGTFVGGAGGVGAEGDPGLGPRGAATAAAAAASNITVVTAIASAPPEQLGLRSLDELEAVSAALQSRKQYLRAMLQDVEEQESRVNAAATIAGASLR